MSHIADYAIGTFLLQCADGQVACIDGVSEQPRSLGRTHSKRSVLDDAAVGFGQAGTLPSDKVRFGRGFAVTDIIRRNHPFAGKDARESVIQLAEERLLCTARDNPYLRVGQGVEVLQEFVCPFDRHDRSKFLETSTLLLIDGTDMRELLIGTESVYFGRVALLLLAAENLLKDINPRPSLLTITLLRSERETMTARHFIPRLRMVRHGVEKRAVHIKKVSLHSHQSNTAAKVVDLR